VIQQKSDTLVLQVGGRACGLTTPPHKKSSVAKLLNLETGQWRAMLKEAEVPPRTVMPEE